MNNFFQRLKIISFVEVIFIILLIYIFIVINFTLSSGSNGLFETISAPLVWYLKLLVPENSGLGALGVIPIIICTTAIGISLIGSLIIKILKGKFSILLPLIAILVLLFTWVNITVQNFTSNIEYKNNLKINNELGSKLKLKINECKTTTESEPNGDTYFLNCSATILSIPEININDDFDNTVSVKVSYSTLSSDHITTTVIESKPIKNTEVVDLSFYLGKVLQIPDFYITKLTLINGSNYYNSGTLNIRIKDYTAK